ncbi:MULTISPECIES: DUF7882 family protein [unclassified Leifsonia]|uniref:DUF7882 family protein n=1 Tax=unclassified Leifsonia TaxID=2663824 RepID=UPI00070154EA|nr:MULTISPECIES: hypothetical protein [unclassified Leifsonia]KQX06907.1 ATP-dependent DNA ligase [Leifsonia sp. Root1293]KRA11192.1 ATP-dependent DNA ligase [Leifsonia sp. Root60]
MGRFTYDSTLKVEFEDRALAHLQLVVGAKMRRGESFHFSWRDDTSVGDGRTIVWIHPGANVVYKFFGSRPPAINRAWVEALMTTANSSAGLHMVPEPPEDTSKSGLDQ